MPLQVSSQPEIADDPCKDTKYSEPAVDAMRAQKDEVSGLVNIHTEFNVMELIASPRPLPFQ